MNTVRYATKFKKLFLRANKIVLVLIVCLVAIRLALPTFIRNYVNKTLDRIPDYDGQIGDVDLHLWRGAYSIQNIEIIKTTGKIPIPLYKSSNVDLSIQWKALFEGKLVGEIAIANAELNFVNNSKASAAQTEVDSEWLQVVKDLFPLRINRFEINDSEIHFRDFERTPKVNLVMSEVEILGSDFSNTRNPVQGITASVNGTAKIQGHAPLIFAAQVEPASKDPTFNLDLTITSLKIKELNDFLRAYADVDAEGGEVGVDIELATAENSFRGYIKPLIKDIKIFRIKKDSDNPLEFLWEGFVGLIAEIFENQRHSQIATKIPFSGTLNNPEPRIWRTIGYVLENAFIQALKGGIEDRIEIDDVKQESK